MTFTLPDPRWRPDELGQPIPDERHAVSVCLPRWRDNVGYEEGDPAVTDAMQCGYPRFFIHPDTARLFEACEQQLGVDADECCFAFPTSRVAERCAAFVRRHADCPASVVACFGGDVHAVRLPSEARATAKAFWQHSGEIVPSRQAADLVAGRRPDSDATSVKATLRTRIADMIGCSADDVYLFPSGMAAIFAGYRAFQRLRPDARSVQFGFPYVDALKVQQRLSHRHDPAAAVTFYPRGTDDDLDDVERLAAAESLLGIICEVPGNPLLNSPDLQRLSRIAVDHEAPLMVDDTLGACLNLDVLPVCDVVTTSLTKFFSGAGNVLAGSLVLNRQRPFYSQLKASLAAEYEDLLYPDEAILLESNSRDIAERVPRINDNTLKLCEFLKAHPAVDRVYYPAFSADGRYAQVQRPGAGFGGLFSVVLHDSARTTAAFYDALQISKGPNLGTSFSLCCPYTILAHYEELDFAEECGISRYLVRVSAGLEDADVLIERFRNALATVPA